MKTFSQCLVEIATANKTFDDGVSFLLRTGRLDLLPGFLASRRGDITRATHTGSSRAQMVLQDLITLYGHDAWDLQRPSSLAESIVFLVEALGVRVPGKPSSMMSTSFDRLVRKLVRQAPDDPNVEKIVSWSVARELEA